MIYVSTGGFSANTALETVGLLTSFGINAIELSGGVYSPSQLSDLELISDSYSFQVHNYFPPPKSPFVFNLASIDSEIAVTSYNHAIRSIKLAHDLGSTTYSFHAGFLIDPHVSELGQKIQSRALANRSHALDLFIARLNQLSIIAHQYGIQLLVENNVLSSSNHQEFQANPLLMVTADECITVMNSTPSNVNLLIDVAHLKVSAQSLLFDSVHFLEVCSPWTNAYHLSDNNGLSDQNLPCTDESWFWSYLKHDLEYYSVEVYSDSSAEILNQLTLAQKYIY